MEIPEVFALRTTSKGHLRGRRPLTFTHLVEQESVRHLIPSKTKYCWDEREMRGERDERGDSQAVLSSKDGNHFGPECLWLVLGLILNVYVLCFLEGFEIPGSLLTSRTFMLLLLSRFSRVRLCATP